MELKECIKDAIDGAMQSYILTDLYKEKRIIINESIESLRKKLDSGCRKELNSILDLISNLDAEFATEAYVSGVVNGIALRDGIMK